MFHDFTTGSPCFFCLTLFQESCRACQSQSSPGYLSSCACLLAFSFEQFVEPCISGVSAEGRKRSAQCCSAVLSIPIISNSQVQDYRAGCDAAASAVNELEQQKSKIKAELAEVRTLESCCDTVSFSRLFRDRFHSSWTSNSSAKLKMFRSDWRYRLFFLSKCISELSSLDSLASNQVDLRASVGLEGYRRNIGDEIGAAMFVSEVHVDADCRPAELIRQKLGVRRSAFNT